MRSNQRSSRWRRQTRLKGWLRRTHIHIRHFTTLCNTVHQEGGPDEWFKWNLFPYSLASEAKTWYSFASFVVEGNWNKLTKKSCEKFFLISKVQHLRRQVITFTQGEEEGIDQTWNRFNELIEQGCWRWKFVNLAMSLPSVLAWLLYLIHWY
jgi:hypothetical protein